MSDKKYLGEFPTFSRADWTQKQWAIEYIKEYGGISGDHHKAWLVDQVARILHGTVVLVTEAYWSDGSREIRFRTGKPPNSYLEWVESIKLTNGDYEEGIAP
jgi:hypothetical protein